MSKGSLFSRNLCPMSQCLVETHVQRVTVEYKRISKGSLFSRNVCPRDNCLVETYDQRVTV